MNRDDFITYENEYGGITTTNMYANKEDALAVALARVERAKAWKLKQPVDKRTRFYKYLVEEGIVEAGQTIYNKDCINILDKH